MRETLRLILVLTLTATLTGALLALANMLTAEPIAAARRAELLNALSIVLPPHANEPDRDRITITVDGKERVFYPARQDGRFAGVAFTSETEGYGGAITVMIGVDAADRIHAVRILDQLETPGLGANITRPQFTAQFEGRPAAQPGLLAIRQDGGAIQAITAATVSSRAVSEAVNKGLSMYLANRAAVRAVPVAEAAALTED